MMLALLGALAVYGAWSFSSRFSVSPFMKNLFMVVGLILLLADFYTSLVLPYQIGKFYNGGDGITYGNATRFDDSDPQVAYFMAQASSEWALVENAKLIAIALMFPASLFLAYRYLVETPAGGQGA